MSSTSLPQSIESLYTSAFFATIMTTSFYGITSMQLFYYYIHYQGDPLRTKLLVAALWGLNTIHEALTITGTYKFILASVLGPSSLSLSGIYEFIAQLVITALAAVLAQGYFIYRIYVVSEKNFVPPLVIWAILGCCQLGGTSFYLYKALYLSDGAHIGNVTGLNIKLITTIATSILSIGAGVDILIAVSLTYLLLRKRTASSFASTAHVLQRLILLSVNTGSWTALFALLTIILMHTYSKSISVVFAIPLCSVYCNTVIANLNARQHIRSETTGPNVDTEQVVGSRGIDVIMISTDRQKEKMMSTSSAPLGQRDTVSFTDGDVGERSVSWEEVPI